jgi:ferredoxin
MVGPRDGVAITIDRIACDGFGMCAELLPELIELDDWGYPIVAPGAVPKDLLEHARRAVTVCPVLAFGLRRVPPSTTVAPGERTSVHAAARKRI